MGGREVRTVRTRTLHQRQEQQQSGGQWLGLGRWRRPEVSSEQSEVTHPQTVPNFEIQGSDSSQAEKFFYITTKTN